MTKILTADEKLRKLVHGSRDTLGLKLYNHLEKEQRQEPTWTDLEDIAPIRDQNYLNEVTSVANTDEYKYDGNYYVVTAIRSEPLLAYINTYGQKVIPKRKTTFTRKSCPTPSCDQVVWKVIKNDKLELLWSIPAKKRCTALWKFRTTVPPHLYPEMQQVIQFKDGSFDRKCEIENGEQPGSPLLIKTPIYTSTGAVWNKNSM